MGRKGVVGKVSRKGRQTDVDHRVTNGQFGFNPRKLFAELDPYGRAGARLLPLGRMAVFLLRGATGSSCFVSFCKFCLKITPHTILMTI
jgi:hypothetical protein